MFHFKIKNASEGDLDDTDIKIIEDTINAMDFNRPIGHVKKVELIKGMLAHVQIYKR